MVVNLYSNLLNNFECSNLIVQQEMVNDIPQLVLEEDNKMLTTRFTDDEIHKALNQLNPDKARGLEGFPIDFLEVLVNIRTRNDRCIRRIKKFQKIPKRSQ